MAHKMLRSTVHPRLRGEHRVVNPVAIGPHGSSPLTRGTPTTVPPTWPRFRFIPAYAGNTAFPGGLLGWRGFIPAYAGNTPADSGVALLFDGSSPLTRGTPLIP